MASSGRVKSRPIAVPSLQSGFPEEERQIFHLELGGWFPALKWLIKVRFWIDRYESHESQDFLGAESQDWTWPTADKPLMPATAQEVRLARCWPREAVERRVAQLFELRRRLCPATPILVPLQQLEEHDAPRSSSATKLRGTLNQFRDVRKPKIIVAGQPHAPPAGPPARGPKEGPRAMCRETRDRLYPAFACLATPQLQPEQFASRLIDLAIEFDGSPQRAQIEGPQLISKGLAAFTQDSRRPDVGSFWQEGRSSLQDLNLLAFWLKLGDKSSLGLSLPLGQAQQVLEERIRGTSFADGVFRVFWARFRFECLDAGALYRFWLSMPKAVRSANHIRGMPEKEAFELLREAVVRRSEKKAAGGDSPLGTAETAEGRRPWRPGGEAMQVVAPQLDPAMLSAARAMVLPPGTAGSRRGLEFFSRPKLRPGALPFLQALERRFPQDVVLRRMVKQALRSEGSEHGFHFGHTEFDGDLLKETDILKKAAGRGAVGQPPLQIPSTAQQQGSMKLWLASDHQRAGRMLDLLKSAQEKTRKINGFIRREVARCLGRGLRHGHAEDAQAGLMMADNLFAQLCRHFGTKEILARFGSDYLPMNWASKPTVGLPGTGPRGTQGGPTADCAVRKAVCTASSAAPGCEAERAVDGLSFTGFSPDLSQNSSVWWMADLGKCHGCGGLRLEWTTQRRREAKYVTRLQLRSDLLLEGGSGSPIVVVAVRPGGTAHSAGVAVGDSLRLGAGGDGDKAFQELPAMEALATLQAPGLLQHPCKLVFETPDASKTTSPAIAAAKLQNITIRVQASKLTTAPGLGQGVWTLICEESVTAGPDKVCLVPAIFVGRWVRIELPRGWPIVDGQALLLSVGVVKVWRIAPPAFRQLVFQAMRQNRPSRFWAGSWQSSTFNAKIRGEVARQLQRTHEGDFLKEEELQKACAKDKKEFNVIRSDETRALRERLFSRDDDVRECTFHPRAAGNVPLYIKRMRDRIERTEKDETMDDFVRELGTNFDSTAYNKYRLVHRRMALSRAKREFVKGSVNAALTKLKSSFGIDQLLERFRCHHKGCGKLLSHWVDNCACGGFYCRSHESRDVHNCKDMAKLISQRAQQAKKLDTEQRARLEAKGEVPPPQPPEEKFDNKAELGLLLEAKALAESILAAKRAKEQQHRSLEQLGQSLAACGALGLLERPFKGKMCPKALARRRRQEHSSSAPLFARPRSNDRSPRCHCPDAHDPKELRFAAGESIHRRAMWLQEALVESKRWQDVVTGSAAERVKSSESGKDQKGKKKDKRAKSQPRRGGGRLHAARRSSSEPRPGYVKLKAVEEKRQEAMRAMDLVYQAKARLNDGEIAQTLKALEEARHLAEGVSLQALNGLSDRGLVHWEKQDVRRQSEELAREAKHALQQCKDLEEHVRWAESVAAPSQATSEGKPWHVDAGDAMLKRLTDSRPPAPGIQLQSHTGKQQMCIDFLDAGTCTHEDRCPFAHHPSELAGRTLYFQDDIFMNWPLREAPKPMERCGQSLGDADDLALQRLLAS